MQLESLWGGGVVSLSCLDSATGKTLELESETGKTLELQCLDSETDLCWPRLECQWLHHLSRSAKSWRAPCVPARAAPSKGFALLIMEGGQLA